MCTQIRNYNKTLSTCHNHRMDERTRSQIRYSSRFLRIQLEVKFRKCSSNEKMKNFQFSRTKLLDNVVVMLHNFISFERRRGLHVSMLHKYWRNVCLLTIISPSYKLLVIVARSYNMLKFR